MLSWIRDAIEAYGGYGGDQDRNKLDLVSLPITKPVTHVSVFLADVVADYHGSGKRRLGELILSRLWCCFTGNYTRISLIFQVY